MQDDKKRLPLRPNGKVVKKTNGKVWVICHYIDEQLFGYFEFHHPNGNANKMYYAR